MIHDFDGVLLNLPEWVTEFRPHQVQAVREILDHFDNRKVVMVDAPTGAGKTLIGEMVRQVLMWRKLTNKGIYVCSSKTLQEQILHDFPYARVIKGRSNYPTLDNPRAFELRGDRHISAANCTKMRVEEGPVCNRCEDYPPDIRYGPGDDEAFLHCYTCHPWQHCPYEVAKGSALDAKLTVANTAYFLTEANYVGRFGAQESSVNPWHSRLLIMDEADTIESIILGYVELSIPKRVLRELDLGVPRKVTVAESWLEWCDMAYKRINEHVTELAGETAKYHNAPPPTKLQDELDRWGKNLHQIGKVASSIRQDPAGWVLDGYQDGNVSFRPIEISSFARELLWRHSERFLLMSATLVSPRQMAADLGLQDHEWESVEVLSSFPPERRLVNVRGAAKMAFKTKDVEWPKLAEAIGDILDMYPNDRILVHTVSYELTQFLLDSGNRLGALARHRDRLLSYSTSKEREQVLATYRNKLGAVLLAPSLDRGVDLKDDDCRVVIVTKVPFPSLGDKRISQRLYGTRTGESWYAMQTVRSLVQMTGRAMRHEDDYMTAFILDSQFIHITWKNALSRNMIPGWWAEALVWEAPKRRV